MHFHPTELELGLHSGGLPVHPAHDKEPPPLVIILPPSLVLFLTSDHYLPSPIPQLVPDGLPGSCHRAFKWGI